MLKHFCLLAALGAVASAHTMVTNFIYNGKNETTCVRYAQSTDPVIDLASDAVTSPLSPPLHSILTPSRSEDVSF